MTEDSKPHISAITRRKFLKAGGIGALALSLRDKPVPQIPAAAATSPTGERGKAVAEFAHEIGTLGEHFGWSDLFTLTKLELTLIPPYRDQPGLCYFTKDNEPDIKYPVKSIPKLFQICMAAQQKKKNIDIADYKETARQVMDVYEKDCRVRPLSEPVRESYEAMLAHLLEIGTVVGLKQTLKTYDSEQTPKPVHNKKGNVVGSDSGKLWEEHTTLSFHPMGMSVTYGLEFRIKNPQVREHQLEVQAAVTNDKLARTK